MARIALAHLAVALVVALGACGSESSSFTGTWVLDIEASLTPEQRKELESSPQQKESWEKMKKAWAMEIEIRADGTARANIPGVGPGDGRWEQKDGVLTIRGEKGPPLELRLRDGNLVGTIPGKGNEATFRRK